MQKKVISPPSFRILFHGGAGVITNSDPERTLLYKEALRSHVMAIGHWLTDTSSQQQLTALDVVEFVVKRLEDDILFNAGQGSVYTKEAGHELEASIMCGRSGRCGAVSLVKHTKNPVSLARLILEHPYHNYLAGDGAEALGRERGLEQVEESYYDSPFRYEQLLQAHRLSKTQSGSTNDAGVVLLDHHSDPNPLQPDPSQSNGNNSNCSNNNNREKLSDRTGTVGCVCMWNGDIAAATSTGGMTNKLPGRIGDSPIIGAGTYANNETCAVSCTGVGEEFMRHVVAYDVAARIAYRHDSLRAALRGSLFDRSLPADCGGAIAVTAQGEVAMEFNTVGMYRGMLTSEGEGSIAIWQEEETFPVPSPCASST
eukprot:gene6817-7530_t